MPSTQATANQKRPRVGDRVFACMAFFQTCWEEEKNKKKADRRDGTERVERRPSYPELLFSEKCAQKWRYTSDKEKDKFQEMVDGFEVCLKGEMREDCGGDEDAIKPNNQQEDPDPSSSAPEKPQSASTLFCRVQKAQIKAAHPDYKCGDIFQDLVRKWMVETDEITKSMYEAMAVQDQTRYQAEMRVYLRKELNRFINNIPYSFLFSR